MHHLRAVVGRFLACLLLVVTGVGAAGYLQLLLVCCYLEARLSAASNGEKKAGKKGREKRKKRRGETAALGLLAGVAGCCWIFSQAAGQMRRKGEEEGRRGEGRREKRKTKKEREGELTGDDGFRRKKWRRGREKGEGRRMEKKRREKNE